MDINTHWYRSTYSVLSFCLLPFSFLFRGIVALRRFLFKKKLLNSYAISVPVIVVGNINVGGTGKTPTVIWLANFLKENGYNPGVISRGYGGKLSQKETFFVNSNTSVREVGDEALLLYRNTDCPIAINKNRVAGANALIAEKNCNVIISDDGLQHYRLQPAIEIAVIDNSRRFGNNELLPAGPLREPISRLKEVDFIFSHPFSYENENSIEYVSDYFCNVKNNDVTVPLENFSNKKVHAIAAIGNPQRFFNQLRSLGINIIEHTFPDHYHFDKNDINFPDELPVVMTEKDAVKCLSIATERHWFLPVKLEIEEKTKFTLLNRLKEITNA